jgi:phosphopantetheine adenylyltransferase
MALSKPLPSLLLLSQPPTAANAAPLSAAYKPAITATVSALKTLSTSTELLIVLPCPSLHARLQAPRPALYDDAQHLLAAVYSLFASICARLGADVESEAPGSIDARIILLDYNGSSEAFSEDDTFDTLIAGPIIDLPTFAATRRRWNIVFSVDGEEGQKLLASYSKLANRTQPRFEGHVRSVPGGVSLVQKDSEIFRAPTGSFTCHNVVAVGGTFDHLHAGHKLLLTATALLLQPASRVSTTGRRLIVGITGDELLKNKKYAEYMKSWKQRQDDVVDFLLSILSFTRSGREEAIQTLSFDEPTPNGRAIHTKLNASSITIECVEIQDPFGPTITDESVTALIVSGETRSGGQAVNDKRAEKGWKSLETFEVDVLDAGGNEEAASKSDDFESKISSTAIRKRKAENARTSSL